MPNGVTFRITNENLGITKIVHHDKLNPVRNKMSDVSDNESSIHDSVPSGDNEGDGWTSSASSSGHSDYSPSENSDSDNDSDDSHAPPDGDRRYPGRNRTPRVIPGAIPWNAVPRL